MKILKNISMDYKMNKINLTNGYHLEATPEKEVFDFIHANGALLFDDDVFYLPDNYYTTIEKEKKEQLQSFFPNQLCFAYFIKKEEVTVGAFVCKGINSEDFDMWITAILPEHRRKGIYKEILKFAIEKAKELGFQKITSQHAATNNPVIIAKLKAGFVINGFEVNDKCGMMLTLIYFFNELRMNMYEYRVGTKLPTDEMKNILEL
jgi:RimJ/RimL family protein N-acetyltransferase